MQCTCLLLTQSGHSKALPSIAANCYHRVSEPRGRLWGDASSSHWACDQPQGREGDRPYSATDLDRPRWRSDRV